MKCVTAALIALSLRDCHNVCRRWLKAEWCKGARVVEVVGVAPIGLRVGAKMCCWRGFP